MDPLFKNLLVEVARTVLRVLEPPAQAPVVANPQPAPLLAVATPPRAERGSTVRVWTGDRYEAGVVEAISRDHQQVTVRVKRAEGHRDKLVKVLRDRAEVLVRK